MNAFLAAGLKGPTRSRAVLISLISDSGIGIAIRTKEPEPEPTPEWNRLQVWNRLHPKVNLTIEEATAIKAVWFQPIFIKFE